MRYNNYYKPKSKQDHMDLIPGQKEALRLQDLFINEMYKLFGISKHPSSYPISFGPLFSLGGLKRNINFGLEIVLNDTLIIDPIDKLQLEQAIWHETGHILHLIGNDWKIGEENNNTCNEPIGSIIADLGVLVFCHSTKRKAEDYFSKLSDYAGPAKELFILAESCASEPIIPLRLFHSRDFALACIIMLLTGCAFYPIINTLQLFFQRANSMTATQSGLASIPLMIAVTVATIIQGKYTAKTGIYYLTITLALFAIGGSIFYFSLQNIINDAVSEHLFDVKEQIQSYAKEKGEIPKESPIGTDKIIFTPVDQPLKQEMRDTILYDRGDEEYLPFRTLIFSVKAGEINYKVSITKPLIESDDLIESIATSLSELAGILLVVLILLNWWLSKKMWQPFYKTLDALRKFDVSKKEMMQFSPVKTSEFKMLNTEIEKMTKKIQHDYRNLKEFTENASHEIQTPIAIMRSKLELMIQSENIPKEQIKSIQEIYESVNRLSKLNQSLLLLAKIENRQFDEMQTIDLKKLIENKLEQFEDMIAFKKISVEKNIRDTYSHKMNSHLADILLSNIIGNSIKHNVSEGKIKIELKNNMLTISNTGNALETPAEKLFERFQKASPSSDSVGLGLSIVKQICDTYNLKVRYNFTAGMHIISISF